MATQPASRIMSSGASSIISSADMTPARSRAQSSGDVWLCASWRTAIGCCWGLARSGRASARAHGTSARRSPRSAARARRILSRTESHPWRKCGPSCRTPTWWFCVCPSMLRQRIWWTPLSCPAWATGPSWSTSDAVDWSMRRHSWRRSTPEDRHTPSWTCFRQSRCSTRKPPFGGTRAWRSPATRRAFPTGFFRGPMTASSTT